MTRESEDLNDVSFTDTEFRVVQCILSHPEYLPTVPEITFITELREDVVTDTLRELQANGIIDTYTNSEAESNESDTEIVFYGFTETGLNVINSKPIFNDLSLLRELYKKAIENMTLPETVEEHVAVDRPEKRTP